jgi:hypothetical protein
MDALMAFIRRLINHSKEALGMKRTVRLVIVVNGEAGRGRKL